MKYITNFFRAGFVALLAMLVVAPGAVAQFEPDAVDDLAAAATANAQTSITLTWMAPEDNGLPISRYRIQVSTVASNRSESDWSDLVTAPAHAPADGADQTYVHDQDNRAAAVAAGTTYHYRVAAINASGQGGWSNVDSAAPNNVPDAIAGLTAMATMPTDANDGVTSITLNWMAPESNGLAITGYRIQVSTDAGTSWSDLVASHVPAAEGTAQTYEHDESGTPPVTVGTTFHYQVAAINLQGTGAFSNVASAAPHNVPGAPVDPRFVSVTVNDNDTPDNPDDDNMRDIAISWGPPSSTGGLDITAYQVQHTTDGTTWTALTPNVDHEAGTTAYADTHTVDIIAIDADPSVRTYFYRVVAINAASNTSDPFIGGNPSDLVSVRYARPDMPQMLTGMAVDGQEAIDLMWDEPENIDPGFVGYKVERSTSTTSTVDWTNTAEVSELVTNYARRSYRDRALDIDEDTNPNPTFHYRVTAINVVGEGMPTEHISVTSSNAAEAPTDLSAMAVTDANSIELTWNAPDENGGSLITGYKIEVSEDGGAFKDLEENIAEGMLLSAVGSEKDHRYRHDDVEPGISYTYRVSAINHAGAGAVSAVSNAVRTDARVPNMPTALMASPLSPTSIMLSWMAPERNGGSAITGYRIEVSESSGGDFSDLVANTGNTETTYTHMGLSLNDTRYYRVSAINGVGTGDASAVASATTGAVAPSMPTGLTATASGINSIELSWTAPAENGGAEITAYKIEVSETGMDDSFSDQVANTGSIATTYTHTGLDRGDTRHYRVSAINSVGTGMPSAVAMATTESSVTRRTTASNLKDVLGNAEENDIILIQTRRAGDTVVISDDVTINTIVTIGIHVGQESAEVDAGVAAKANSGTLNFTGSVTLNDGGNFKTHSSVNSVHFTTIEVNGMDSSIDTLVVSRDVVIEEGSDPDDAVTSVLAVDQLVVNAERTLTIEEDANVRVRLRKDAGKFDVKGTIAGGGDLWIAHTSGERAADGFMLHEPGDYKPGEDKFTADDCLMVTGSGTIETDLYAVAAGNVCVSLGEIGRLVAVGSIMGTADITTDVIFRNGVTVNGDLQQWNDARVVFEKNATIEESVTLNYGDAGVGSSFGTPIMAPASFEREGYSGVEFAGASNMIEDDLALEFEGGTDKTRALFSIAQSGTENMSTVGRDLIIEHGGEVYLGGSAGNPSDSKDNPRAHNLSVGRDVLVYHADAEIMMGHPAASTISSGLCSAPGLGVGNRVTFTGRRAEVEFNGADMLTIQAVAIASDVTVKTDEDEDVMLVATTVHVTEDGELNSAGTVQVSDALILQGDGLEGTLAAGSTVNNIVYATVDSDDIGLGNSVMRLAVDVGADRELRVSDPVDVAYLGLCSGTLVLVDPDTEMEMETVTVTEKVTVKGGFLSLDASRPGSLGTDVTKPNAAAGDGYILEYVTEGERMAGAEWSSATRKVAVNHKDAVIIVNEAKSLVEGIHMFNGHLHLKGEGSTLTIGMPMVAGVSPFLMIDNAQLLANGNNVVVHGRVAVAMGNKEAGKIMTGDGELHVLGMTSGKDLSNATAMVTVGGDGDSGGSGMIDVGTGALQLGPAATNPKDGLHGDWQYPIATDARPHVKLDVNKGSVMGTIRVPQGSKQTEVIGVSFDTIVFDGMATPNKDKVTEGNGANWNGTLYLVGSGANITVDSLDASNGAVEFRGTKATVTKDVAVSSSALYQELKTLDFKGGLAISGDGGFSSRGGAADNRKAVMIGGDYMQTTTQTGGINEHDPKGGSNLSEFTDKTVMGAFMVSGTGHASRYATRSGTSLTLKGDFNFGLTAKDYVLHADLEFSGKEAQMVSAAADIGSVEVNNSAGIMLGGNVMQGSASTLTLTKGTISSDMYTWTVKNTGIEEDLRGRNNARMTCASDANCASVITGGSRRDHVSAGVSRHVMYGNSGDGEASGGYLFPVGSMEGEMSYYRPLILQFEDNLSEAMSVTVAPVMVPDDTTPFWPSDNIVVPVPGGSLTLDAHADIFWEVKFGEDAVDERPHVRIAADGLVNVFDDSRLRMVQWDCEWDNPRLAGISIVGTDEESFAENGFVKGVLNLTQESVEVGTCAILGIASNGIENPIHRDEITGGLSEIQLIHNAVLPVPVDISLDGALLESGMTFQNATGYTMVGAGSHQIQLQLVGVPAEQAVEIELPTLQAEKSYALIAHGTLDSGTVKTVETRKMSSTSNMVEAILVHGSGDAPAVNISLLDPYNSNELDRLLTRELAFDQATKYLQLEPDFVNLQVTDTDHMEIAVFQLDLSGRQGEAVILNLSNVVSALEVYGVDVNGDRVSSYVVTDIAEVEELPTEFALHGNYPNPFNPSTRIQFDLPMAAQVSLQIVDMLGREVMTIPAKEYEAGANRSIELNAINLASGTYLYRMIATGAESRHVKTGRMTLVK